MLSIILKTDLKMKSELYLPIFPVTEMANFFMTGTLSYALAALSFFERVGIFV